MGHGRGGHFYSLFSTVKAISIWTNPIVLNIGVKPSPVFSRFDPDSYVFLQYKKSLFELQRGFNQIVQKHTPDVIHSFDETSLFFARNACRLFKIPLIHTKCGGPNPKRYFPFVGTLILYSQENFEYFSSSKKFKSTRKFLIPNRVLRTPLDTERTEELKSVIPAEGFIFMRIARISRFHLKSIMDSIRLIRWLREEGLVCTLLIIGVIQDHETLKTVKDNLDEHVILVTDEKFTVNASGLMGIADAIIGTGRSAMEAAMHGKILLAPVKNWDTPALVNENNISTFLFYNFSERTILPKCQQQKENLAFLKRIILNPLERLKLQKFIECFGREHFDIENKVETIIQAEQQATVPHLRFFDMALLGLRTWRNLSRYRRN